LGATTILAIGGERASKHAAKERSNDPRCDPFRLVSVPILALTLDSSFMRGGMAGLPTKSVHNIRRTRSLPVCDPRRRHQAPEGCDCGRPGLGVVVRGIQGHVMQASV
jgi:hypothetical protein